jgi:hypothetical protein
VALQHATRILISIRQTLINSSTDYSGSEVAAIELDVRQPNSSTSRGTSVFTPTKKEYYRQQADTLEEVSSNFASSIDMQKQYLNVKRKNAEIKRFKLLRDTGVLTKVEVFEQLER